jgi:hypothetical protein
MIVKGKQSSKVILPNAPDVQVTRALRFDRTNTASQRESTMTTTTVETSSTDSHFTMTVAATDDVAVAVVTESSQEQQTLPLPQDQQEEATANLVKRCNRCLNMLFLFYYFIFLGGCVFLIIDYPVIGLIVVVSVHCVIACAGCLLRGCLLQYVWGQDVDRFLKLGNFTSTT